MDMDTLREALESALRHDTSEESHTTGLQKAIAFIEKYRRNAARPELSGKFVISARQKRASHTYAGMRIIDSGSEK